MTKMGFAAALNRALDQAMAANSRLILLGEDIADAQGGGVLKVTKDLSSKYGTKRVRSTPISEEAIIGAAVGAAVAGHPVVAEIMLMNFITVGMDQLVNHAAKLRYMSGGQTSVPIVIRSFTGAGIGAGGQHSDMLEAWLAHSPGIKVVAPSRVEDAPGLLLAAIQDPDPVMFIEHVRLFAEQGEVADTIVPIPLSQAHTLREGSDVTVIGYAKAIAEATIAADRLRDQGISVEVIDLRTIVPYDRKAVIASVRKTRRALVVHDAVKAFGVGAEITAMLQQELFGHLLAPVMRVGGPYASVPFSRTLEAAYMVTADRIADAITAMMK
jgi:pyruvate/2-oxoglutarate/acetoin dehydrogenase E1 component